MKQRRAKKKWKTKEKKGRVEQEFEGQGREAMKAKANVIKVQASQDSRADRAKHPGNNEKHWI
jgi:hypothetical protein